MTEEEALTKWCPFARVGNASGCNRYPMENDLYKGEAFAKCVGSVCMAWQSDGADRGEILERHRALPGSHRPAGPDWGYLPVDEKGGDWVRFGPPTKIFGHCGLAGNPHA